MNEDKLQILRRLGSNYVASKQSFMIHNLINLTLLGLTIGIFVCLNLLIIEGPVTLWLISPVVYSIVFFSWFILVVHEASHFMFIMTKSVKQKKLLNQIFAYPFCSLSFQDFYESWQVGHIEHHRKPIVEDDPQNCPSFCMQGRELYKSVLLVLLVPGYAFFKQSSCVTSNRKAMIKGIIVGIISWAFMAYINTIFFHPALTIVQLMGANITMAINLIKVSLEHGGEIGRNDQFEYRSKSSTFPLRHLLMPFNISLHFEHHFNMHIPWYHLGKYHQDIKKSIPKEEWKYHYNLGLKESLNQIRG